MGNPNERPRHFAYQYIRPAFREIEITLRESRKRMDRGDYLAGLWFIYRGFQELHEAEAIVCAIERDEGKI